MPTLRFDTAECSTRGGRTANQDSVGYRPVATGACWVVADGLGGHRGGEVASRTATDAILHAFETRPGASEGAMRRLIQHSQDAIRQRQSDEDLASMRTTVVALAIHDGAARWAHVGDSRLYAFRGGRILAHTQDHSVPQALVAAGQISAREARTHADRNRVLRCLGSEDDAAVTVSGTPLSVHPGDAFLLCTDGFWEYVSDLEMTVDLAKAHTASDWLLLMEDRLLLRADGDFDNYSALAIFAG
jgi:serine/threonine protein phosphatase PrpC